MFRATLITVAALTLAPIAIASHPSWMLDRKVNLDGDRALERIVAEYDVSFDHKVEEATIMAFDRCRASTRRYALAAPGRSLEREGILGPDALGRKAVAFAMAYADGTKIARVVQLRKSRTGACPRPAWLLAYSSRNPPYPAPEGYGITAARLAAGEDSSAHAGKEVVLTEEYSSPRLNPGRKLRHTYFGYSAAKRRYVAYRTEVIPPA
jgi:hypothetical protein